MHQFNHPTSALFNALAERICAYLGVEETRCRLAGELDTVVWPVWPWVRAALGLAHVGKDTGSVRLLLRGQPVPMDAYITGAFATYAHMPEAQRQTCGRRNPLVRARLEAL